MKRVRKECGDASRQVPQILDRGYPQTFVDHLNEKVLAVSEIATGATSLYAEQIIFAKKMFHSILSNQISTTHVMKS